MSESYFGRIAIWGQIKEKDLLDLAEEISNTCMEEINEDYSVDGSDRETVVKTLRGAAEKGEEWKGQDCEARYGSFESLEDWIRGYPGLNYVRYSGSYYDSGPHEEWSLDGSSGSEYYTNDDEQYMTYAAIRHFTSVLESFKEEDAPKLMSSDNWAEKFIARFYLERAIKPALVDFLDSEGTSPDPGALEII
jgi:hypothetical protein